MTERLLLLGKNGNFNQEVIRKMEPFFKKVEILQTTVRNYFPHWLDGSKSLWNDDKLKDSYLKICGLIEDLLPNIYKYIEKKDERGLAEVSQVLFRATRDKDYLILLGDNPQLLSYNALTELALACAENIVKPNHELLTQTVIGALADIADRLNLYISQE